MTNENKANKLVKVAKVDILGMKISHRVRDQNEIGSLKEEGDSKESVVNENHRFHNTIPLNNPSFPSKPIEKFKQEIPKIQKINGESWAPQCTTKNGYCEICQEIGEDIKKKLIRCCANCKRNVCRNHGKSSKKRGVNTVRLWDCVQCIHIRLIGTA
jgi:hypothetical protein